MHNVSWQSYHLPHPFTPDQIVLILQEAAGRGDYRPRLSVEVGDLAVEADSMAEGLSARLKVYRLEAVEHLPTSAPCDSLSAVVLAEV